MARVIRCELPGFPPFTSVFLLQSRPGSCSIKYLPNSTLFFHAWGESSFSTSFTFSALILSPFTCGRFLERKVYAGPPCPHLPLHSLLHYSTLLPLFTNHSLKLRSNLLITSWSVISSQLFSLWHTHLSPWWGHWQLLPLLLSLKFFLPLDSGTHILTLWPFLLSLCWPHPFSITRRDFSLLIPLIFCVLFSELVLSYSFNYHFFALDAPVCISLPSHAPHLPTEYWSCPLLCPVSHFTAQLPHLSVPNSFSHLTILQVAGQNFSHLWLLLCHL